MNQMALIPDRFDPSVFFRLDKISLFSRLFVENDPVWKGLDRIRPVIDDFFMSHKTEDSLPEGFCDHTWVNREGETETIISIEKAFQAKSAWISTKYSFAIDVGSSIEPGVVIKPPIVIGKHTEIRQGAYIRGGAIIGDHCTVGHATEVKTAVFMDHTEAGHFAYVGDSILGRCVNLGAGTKLANLPFRTLKMKEKQEFERFDLKIDDLKIPLERSKIGSILGDGVEIGCNSTIAPGSLIGPDSWVYPCVFVRGGFYAEKSLINLPIANSVKKKR